MRSNSDEEAAKTIGKGLLPCYAFVVRIATTSKRCMDLTRENLTNTTPYRIGHAPDVKPSGPIPLFGRRDLKGAPPRRDGPGAGTRGLRPSTLGIGSGPALHKAPRPLGARLGLGLLLGLRMLLRPGARHWVHEARTRLGHAGAGAPHPAVDPAPKGHAAPLCLCLGSAGVGHDLRGAYLLEGHWAIEGRGPDVPAVQRLDEGLHLAGSVAVADDPFKGVVVVRLRPECARPVRSCNHGSGDEGSSGEKERVRSESRYAEYNVTNYLPLTMCTHRMKIQEQQRERKGKRYKNSSCGHLIRQQTH